MLRCNVLSKRNLVGLQKDQDLLCAALKELGCEVAENNAQENTLFFARGRHQLYDLNLFCQDLNPFWFPAAKKNIFIPNQELIAFQMQKHFDKIETFLCKTQYAKQLFDTLGLPTYFLSFTSEDHFRPHIAKELKCFHLAGKSIYKSTQRVIEAWKQNPDFPELILVQHPDHSIDLDVPNIKYVSSYLGAEDIITLQNRCAIHVCPSETEGWGHYILEALSTKSLVITTDAPPMNELVTRDRGVLVPYMHASKEGLGLKFHVSAEAIGACVKEALAMGDEAREAMGKRARAFFLENERAFKKNLKEFIC